MGDFNEVIPTIDMEEISDKMLNKKIREASERWGCFRVKNHGVSSSLMSEMKKTVRDFHELPYEVRTRNTDVLLGGGYRPISELTPNYESFGVFDVASSESVNNFCDKLEASPNQREIMLNYGKAIDGLAKNLAKRIGESYELADTEFYKEWPSQFRMNKYHFKPELVGKLGLLLHTDPGFISIVHGGEDVDGLEAMDASSRTFFPIKTLPNTLTVNFGDMAKIWSNGRLCNVKHRVRCNKAKIRFTISFFLLGPVDRVLEPPSEFVDDEHPRLYKPVTDGELRKIRFNKNIHAGECLKFITLKYFNEQEKE